MRVGEVQGEKQYGVPSGVYRVGKGLNAATDLNPMNTDRAGLTFGGVRNRRLG
jgi:hypothetical protein